MNKQQLLQGGLGISLLLSSCGSPRQMVSEDVIPDQVIIPLEQETAKPKPTNPDIRNVQIPLMRVNAASVYREMLVYTDPGEENASRSIAGHLTAFIDYPAGSVTLNPKYGNNRAELEKLSDRLPPLLASPKGLRIKLTGYASPDGSTKENEQLAGNRTIQFKNYLLKQYKLPNDGTVLVDWAGEDWEGLRREVAASGKAYTRQVLAILDATADADNRRKQLRDLDKGAVYKDLEKTFFARLRRIELAVTGETPAAKAIEQGSTELDELATRVYTAPKTLSLPELLRIAAIYRPGTEQYREVYELMAFRFPDCRVAQLNAMAAALSLGDKESAHIFGQRCADDPRSYINQGVLLLMDGDANSACDYFRKAMPENPRQARENLKVAYELMGDKR